MKDYKIFRNAVKALVKQVKTLNEDYANFACTVNGMPFKVTYVQGNTLDTIHMNVLIDDKYYRINNYLQDSSKFEVFYEDLKLHYEWDINLVSIRAYNGKELLITVPEVPVEYYLQLCYYFRYYSINN